MNAWGGGKKYFYLLFLDEHHLLFTGYGYAQACRRHDWRHKPMYSPRPITSCDVLRFFLSIASQPNV